MASNTSPDPDPTGQRRPLIKPRTLTSSKCYAADAHYQAASPRAFAATYARAKELLHTSGLTTEDISNLSNRYWEFYLDGFCIIDSAALTVATIHSNLCMGTIAPHAQDQPHLQSLLKQLESFELCGEFMLTEVGHGLDARNIETTATLSPDGKSFDLHTPSLAAAKSMPPTTPLGGVSKVAVVFAQLVVDSTTHGVRAFVARMTDGDKMCRGISTRLLPQRPGCRPLDHALTYFSHVRLERDCLLGGIGDSAGKRSDFLRLVHRVSVGGLALSLINVPALKAAAYLSYAFSQQRTVIDPGSRKAIPILSFPTQYGPIISAAAQAAVLEAAGRHTVAIYQKPDVAKSTRQALSCIFKATATYATQKHLSELTDRCGWRGLFGFNKISELHLALKGNSIAEGDVLVLCIRLASELLQGKYHLPPSTNPQSLLAKHEQGLFSHLQSFLHQDENGPSTHRSPTFAQNVTPRARELIQAIGHRYAYDSAFRSSIVRPELLAVWEADCVLEDAAWYVEYASMTYRELHERRVAAVEKVRPLLQSVVDGFDMERHFGATPLVSREGWEGFVGELPEFGAGVVVRSML